MLPRARFFDDWRLSRIDEEVERLSVNSDTSVAVETTSLPLPRCASAEGVLSSSDDDDDDEPPLPPPPSPLPPPTTKDGDQLDVDELRRLDEQTEALRFLQVKYDTLGKVKVERPLTSVSQQPTTTTTTSGVEETVAERQWRRPCDCSLTSPSDERPTVTVGDSSSRPPQSTAVRSHGSVCERRRPPPPPLPSTHRGECRCTASNDSGSHVDRLQGSVVDDCRYHHRHHHHHHHGQHQHHQLEQFARQQQRCSQTSVSVACQPSQRRQESRDDVDGHRGSSAVCSCDGDRARRGGAVVDERQCCSLLSNAELFQIDLFYRSRLTLVHVCPCPALLYFARAAGSGGGGSSSWRYAAAGVPVIVVDTLRAPRLHVVVAERGTGFELWRHGLTDGVQQYTAGETSTSGGGAAFHTLRLPSGDAARLCFDDAASAGEFHRQLLRLDELYSTGGTGSRNKKGRKTASRASGVHHTRYLYAVMHRA